MTQYSHVEAHIPLTATLLPRERWEEVTSRIIEDPVVTEFRTPPRVTDEALAEWLNLLDSKLDAVLKLLTLAREGFASLPLRGVTIHGGGMVFGSSQNFPAGSVVEIKMVLPTVSPLAMYVYGKVTSTVAEVDGRWAVAVDFVYMEEQVRDEIIEFVFQRERELIREKKEGGQA
ncbi:MAG: PilZ domain-containing protein [Nitrospinae bacterium]|nr:PilZ domain-containing protein [Nitrospinota bacterium]